MLPQVVTRAIFSTFMANKGRGLPGCKMVISQLIWLESRTSSNYGQDSATD
jgi:hypothetical protein